ncbi:MAG: hypothetical protein ACK5C3_05720, partial [bacterium]
GWKTGSPCSPWLREKILSAVALADLGGGDPIALVLRVRFDSGFSHGDTENTEKRREEKRREEKRREEKELLEHCARRASRLEDRDSV